HRREDGGLLRVFLAERRASVDVPVERGLQVSSRRILRGIQGDGINPGDRVMPVGGVIDLAEAAAESYLRLRSEVQAAKNQDSVGFQRVQDGRPIESSEATPVRSRPQTSAP